MSDAGDIRLEDYGQHVRAEGWYEDWFGGRQNTTSSGSGSAGLLSQTASAVPRTSRTLDGRDATSPPSRPSSVRASWQGQPARYRVGKRLKDARHDRGRSRTLHFLPTRDEIEGFVMFAALVWAVLTPMWLPLVIR